MSGQATGWVLGSGPHPDMIDRNGKRYGERARGLRFVLVAIADSANADGEHAHPGFKNIGEMALYEERQVRRLVRELLAENWLALESGSHGPGVAMVFALPAVKESLDMKSIEQRTWAVEQWTSAHQHRTSGSPPNGLPTVSTTRGGRRRGREFPDCDTCENGGWVDPRTMVAPTIVGTELVPCPDCERVPS